MAAEFGLTATQTVTKHKLCHSVSPAFSTTAPEFDCHWKEEEDGSEACSTGSTGISSPRTEEYSSEASTPPLDSKDQSLSKLTSTVLPSLASRLLAALDVSDDEWDDAYDIRDDASDSSSSGTMSPGSGVASPVMLEDAVDPVIDFSLRLERALLEVKRCEEMKEQNECAHTDALTHDDSEVDEQTYAMRNNNSAFRIEVSNSFADLCASYDVEEAVERIARINVPVNRQPKELCELLTRASEQSMVTLRKIGFQLVVQLYQEQYWKASSLEKGLRIFVQEVLADRKLDIPDLPKILGEELHPALAVLVDAGFLKASQHDALTSGCWKPSI